MKEPPFIPRADAERVRKQIADTGEAALTKLAEQLPLFKKSRLPESWVKNFKAVADQLRRDYRLEPKAADDPAGIESRVSGFDPLDGIRLADTA